MLAGRAQMTTSERARGEQALSLQLAAWVRRHLPVLAGQRIAVYWPIQGEPDLRTRWEGWAADGAELALPVVDAVAQPLRFVQWTPGAALRPGRYGIPEPSGPAMPDPDLLVVPCLGFDDRCYRLGYGGGYYDRTLAAWVACGRPRPRVVGVAWDQARLARLVPEPTDLPLDAVITPSGGFERAP